MTIMAWNEELETGIDIVDSQHQTLVEMLNQAAPVLAQSSQASMSDIGLLLDGLLNYTATHFRTEEEMMARLGLDTRSRDQHHASHIHFAEQVSDMARSFALGQGVTGDRLLSFLASWLILHILGEDQALPASLRGNARHIQRILGLYIGNAVKFTERGGIRLTVTKRDTRANGRVHLRFTVSDTGIGVSREAQARLFQPFTQADDSPDRRFEGIGLGLAQVRELARLIDGQVGVDSEPGKGSRFWLELGLALGDAAAPSIQPIRPIVSSSVPQAGPSDVMAAGPMPENLRMALSMLDKLLRAYDTRAGILLEQAAPRLRPYLGARLETLAGRILAFDYDQALAMLRSIQSDAQMEKHHE